MLILLVFKNTKKIKIYIKKKVKELILNPGQYFTYKYRSKTQNQEGNFAIKEEATH
jgi:hypothetical protein